MWRPLPRRPPSGAEVPSGGRQGFCLLPRAGWTLCRRPAAWPRWCRYAPCEMKLGQGLLAWTVRPWRLSGERELRSGALRQWRTAAAADSWHQQGSSAPWCLEAKWGEIGARPGPRRSFCARHPPSHGARSLGRAVMDNSRRRRPRHASKNAALLITCCCLGSEVTCVTPAFIPSPYYPPGAR